MIDELIRAIRERRVVEFEYERRHRVVEPHTLGVLDGVEELLGYQIGGESSSGRLPDWRRFRVRAITNLRILTQRFGSRPGRTGRHASWDTILEFVP
jgi:predicted DNA-binding transcriptional regulator YafY